MAGFNSQPLMEWQYEDDMEPQRHRARHHPFGSPASRIADGSRSATPTSRPARQAAAVVFAKKVEELTAGRYKVQICTAAASSAMTRRTSSSSALGGIDFTVSATGSYAPSCADAEPHDALHRGELQARLALLRREQVAAGAVRQGAGQGFRFPFDLGSGFRNMTTKTPLKLAVRRQGHEAAHLPNEMMRWSLESMGFMIQIMPLPEVFWRVQQAPYCRIGEPIDTIYSNKFYEVAPNITLTNHVQPDPWPSARRPWQSCRRSTRKR